MSSGIGDMSKSVPRKTCEKRKMDDFVVVENKIKRRRKQIIPRVAKETEDHKSCLSNNADLSTNRNVLNWKRHRFENFSCDYANLYTHLEATNLFCRCEKEIEYYSGDLSKIHVYGKWRTIPRKQVAYGDKGLTYSFSGTTIPAKPWTPFLEDIRALLTEKTGFEPNFVLVNRYNNGLDYVGEHRDDEKDLDPQSPIASLSLGQERDFIFKHGDSRGKNATRKIPPVKFSLESGSLLMMNPPTNTYWYHSLPQRKKLTQTRINMTFRKLVTL